MTLAIGLNLLAIIVLIPLSAFFNGSETALTAASRARMHALEEDGNQKAKVVNSVLSKPEKMIGTVLLGMLWKRATPAGGFWGLLAGTVSSIGMWAWVKLDPAKTSLPSMK